ncbi:hypothetical protein EVAR_46994_1 [Eumeta japonica]|uniref:Uncharacterized protein n=1 Tax=Eumeta variegata TaxID=151549 RepID=A0A4C1X5A0_EUMVA|nr:hypothetical protein EVAR_46994_1 [Eumeta japonica]
MCTCKLRAFVNYRSLETLKVDLQRIPARRQSFTPAPRKDARASGTRLESRDLRDPLQGREDPFYEMYKCKNGNTNGIFYRDIKGGRVGAVDEKRAYLGFNLGPRPPRAPPKTDR